MDEKYYRAHQAVEEMTTGIVHLTEEEHAAVVKFLNQMAAFHDGRYCGSCDIAEVGYDREEDVPYEEEDE